MPSNQPAASVPAFDSLGGNARLDADAQIEKRAYSKVFWRIMPFLMLCYVVAYLDRVNVGFAKLQMGQDLAFSETVFGLGAGLFFIGYFLFELPSNLLMHKIGARIWIARIMITWGIISALFLFVQTPTQFYVMRFLLGLAEAGFYPGVILYLTYWFPANRRAKMIALFMSGIPIAGMFGNPLSGWIMDAFNGTHGMRGWQWMFLLEALPAFVIGLLTIFVLRDGIDKAPWLDADEKRVLKRNIEEDQRNAGAAAGKGHGHSLGAVFADRRVWWMCLIYFCFVTGQYALTFWMPTLVKSSGVTGNFNIGLLSAIPFLCAVVVMNILGHSADARRERRWHLIVPALMGAAGFAIAASFTTNTTVAIAALSLAAAGVLTCAPLFWSLPTSFLSGIAAASGIAVVNSVGNLAGFVSPYMVGALKDLTHSTQLPMYVLSAILVVGAVLVWLTPAKLVNR
ncbi:putative metabolite transport protein NicT [Cupriavidus taiwanensis]|uniref:Putative tartrate transporter n=1 Tax=Cupriavidus taiwanensis TaxID=164546 RepID=A0A375GVJ0_9BURK|nr:MFS transporter [Cupriavidus taiwanensis]SOY43511.1 putative transporter, MFS family [Cupriavidus taiwanensis]SOY80237.1 putative transporter, MFS family [Cupriavidus taiwanensis]SOZ51438.1 putative transporter, MFS family [Cupriavidus taiwanensis]SOZ76330.1 putative transporter, MFS family [Cupriavidus taiwanensis]SOZ76830.1 putative transporter, MFS family [Cupriavidus taiwanensis]